MSSLRSHTPEPEARIRQLLPELVRKCIHILIALVPWFAALDRSYTALLLMGGILVYSWAEGLRFMGFSTPFISGVTRAVLRKQEQDHFALGPVTLGLGALLALILFPPRVAAVAVYALAFGDSAATLVGRFLGHLRPAFMAGKSLEGSLSCFAASALAAYLVLSDWRIAAGAGLASMLAEALPFGDFDNLAIPLASGITILILLPL